MRTNWSSTDSNWAWGDPIGSGGAAPSPHTAGPNNAGTGVDNSATGTLSWTNPGNITAADSTYAVAASSAGNNTHYLQGGTYGFSIPAGAVINGITVSISGHKAGMGGGGYTDFIVSIVKSDGSIGSVNKATVTQLNNPTDTVFAYGSSVDLWSETWAASDINNANFGVVASYKSANNTSQVSIDYMQITVNYTS